jgi:hypothetical protein
MLGYGTQFAPEFAENHRIVDAPIDHQDAAPTTEPRAETAASARQTPPVNQKPTPIRNQAPTPQQSEQPLTDEQMQAKATDQQKSSIRTLCKAVGMSEPDDIDTMSFIGAKKLIAAITAEYKTQKAESKQSRPAPASTTPNSGQSKALLDMLNRAKKRVESLDMHWQDAKSDAGLAQVQDADLGPKQIAAINAVVDQYEQRQAGKAS